MDIMIGNRSVTKQHAAIIRGIVVALLMQGRTNLIGIINENCCKRSRKESACYAVTKSCSDYEMNLRVWKIRRPYVDLNLGH